MNTKQDSQEAFIHFALSDISDLMDVMGEERVLRMLQDFRDLKEYNRLKRAEVYHNEFGGVYE